jgi:hypothetical protein
MFSNSYMFVVFYLKTTDLVANDSNFGLGASICGQDPIFHNPRGIGNNEIVWFVARLMFLPDR